MSDYGADPDPNISKAQQLAFTQAFMPQKKTNVMEWTYPDDVTVRKLANKTGKSNALFLFAPPPPPGPIPPDLDPVPAGDACTLCWGNGKAFGVGETPETLVVVIQDVEKGPDWIPLFGEPPNDTFFLEQRAGVPCEYDFANASHIITLKLGPVGSLVQVLNLPIPIQSFLQGGPICSMFFENFITLPFVGGTWTTFIPPIA